MMGAKSSGGIIGTLVVVAIAGYIKFNSWQQNERRREIVRNATESIRSFNVDPTGPASSPDSMAIEKDHMDSVVKAGKRGDLVGMLALCTNIPSGVSASYRKGLEKQGGLIKKFIDFSDEINSRSGTEALDLDVMLAPRFLCGLDGFDVSLKRVDTAISFMDEMEGKIKSFRKEKGGSPTNDAHKRDPFKLYSQWDRAISTMTSTFAVMRRMANLIKKLIRLHRDNPKKWKWEDGEAVYYDADFCESVNSAKTEISELAEQYMRLQNSLSDTQHEAFDKIGNAVEKATSRH